MGVDCEPKTFCASPPEPVPLERIKFSLKGVSNVLAYAARSTVLVFGMR